MATRTTKTTTKTTTSTRATSTKPRTTKTPRATKAKKTTASASGTAAAPVVVDAPTPVVAGPMMRKKELIEAVVARSGVKKKAAKPVVEAMLVVLGEALQDGRALNLHPLGKVKINREKKLASGRMMVARIRQNERPTEADDDADPAVTSTDTSTDTAAE